MRLGSDHAHMLMRLPQWSAGALTGVDGWIRFSPQGASVDVLIVECDPKRAEDLVRHFSNHGIRTQTTNTGQDALARHSEVDAVLLSPKLPDTDGLDACRAIRRLSNVPILMVSEEDDEIECILALKL